MLVRGSDQTAIPDRPRPSIPVKLLPRHRLKPVAEGKQCSQMDQAAQLAATLSRASAASSKRPRARMCARS